MTIAHRLSPCGTDLAFSAAIKLQQCQTALPQTKTSKQYTSGKNSRQRNAVGAEAGSAASGIQRHGRRPMISGPHATWAVCRQTSQTSCIQETLGDFGADMGFVLVDGATLLLFPLVVDFRNGAARSLASAVARAIHGTCVCAPP